MFARACVCHTVCVRVYACLWMWVRVDPMAEAGDVGQVILWSEALTISVYWNRVVKAQFAFSSRPCRTLTTAKRKSVD